MTDTLHRSDGNGEDTVLLQVTDGVAVVTLNRPGAMNALSREMRRRLYQVMSAIRDDKAVKAVVLTGAGEKAFTAGLDLKELGSDSGMMAAATDPDPFSNPVNAVRSCGKPVVGAINGVAVTGGFEVALACDILVASTHARFADTHALVGIMPGWGLSQKLPRIVGSSRAKELSFAGRFLDAGTAQQWGLVNRVVEPADLVAQATALAEDIAFVDGDFLRGYRDLIETGYNMPFDAAIKHERLTSTIANATVPADAIEQRRVAVMERSRSRR
jgi:enoyl-CoA hydratase